MEPWPYGGPDHDEENRRYFQGLVFAQDSTNKNPDSNFYNYPLPLIPIMDAHTREIVRIDRLATGGKDDGLTDKTHSKRVLDHCEPAEYVPELLKDGTRQDLKPLHVVQPDGASFQVTDESLVEWQKWRFRVGFNPREGATLHDIHYDGRSVLHRLAVSEMVSTYLADPVLEKALTLQDCSVCRRQGSFPPKASVRLWRRRRRKLCKQSQSGMRLSRRDQGMDHGFASPW